MFAAILATLAPAALAAQPSDPAAERIVRAAVQAELNADATDHSAWIYRDHDVQPGRDVLARYVETPQGSLSRVLERNGQPLTPVEDASETQRIDRYVHDTGAQARDRRNSAHDDAQASAMLRMLPEAFVWTIRSETPERVTLDYRPNPDFNAPNIEAKVMSQMAGEMVVTRPGDHIYTLRGKLLQDVHVGMGLVRLKAGGTFDVERREIAPGHWQIVEQHTHIQGHALLFKTISEQEDEWKTEFRPSTANTLAEAERILNRPAAVCPMCGQQQR